MAKLFNRAKMTTSTTGSGTVTLSAAAGGFQSFADAGVSNGDVVQYLIEEGSAWEIGTGTYSSTGTSLTRTPSESSDGGTAITLGGAANVAITAVADDLNRLQHEGSTKVSVSATGASVTGALTTSGDLTVNGEVAADLSFGDNTKAKFGASDDLQIYHDGSNSYIKDAGAGQLRLLAQNFQLMNAAGTADMVVGIDGGTVQLKYNGATKLATTSTGIDVTGTVTADGLTVESGIGNTALLGVSTDSGTEVLLADQVGGVSFKNVNGDIELRVNGAASTAASTRLAQKIDGGTGDISFYEDTGTTAKFFWDASAERLGIGTSSPSQKLHLGGTAPMDSIIRQDSTVSGTNWEIGERAAGKWQIWEDDGDSVVATFQSNGNVGIGTSSPSADLHIVDDVVTLSLESDNSNAQKWNLLSTYTNTGGSYGAFIIEDEAGSDWLRFDEGNGSPFSQFLVNGTERMRIDSSGNVGIGTSSPFAPLTVKNNPSFGIYSTFGYYSDNYPQLMFGTNASTASTAHIVASTLVFNNSTSSEAMRIDSSGNLLVGTTDVTIGYTDGDVGFAVDGTNGYFGVARSPSSSTQALAYLNRLNSDGDIVQFRKDGATVGSIANRGSTVLQIYSSSASGLDFGGSLNPMNNGSIADNAIDLGWSGARFKDAHFSGTVNAANFNTTSDATLKTNVETLTGSLDAVKALRGVSYDWIDSGNSEVGVIAQEVEAVVPDVVSTNDQGIKSVKYGNLVGVLIEAIKEQQQRIEALEVKLNS